jgi:AcrR family transcriptional regulator
MSATKIPLRERKYVRTKLQLVQALQAALEKQSLEQLSVRTLCEAAEISEATFFNYFPKKTDLLDYLGRLWALELNWYTLQAAESQPGLAAIQALFEQAARHVQQAPGTYG